MVRGCDKRGRSGKELVKRGTRTFQRELKRFSRYADDEGTNEPAQSLRDIAGERDGFQLDVDAAIALPEAPVGIESPQKTAVVAYGLLKLARLSSAFHFCYARTVGLAVSSFAVQAHIVHLVIGVQNNSYNFRFAQAKGELKVIAVVLDQFGAEYMRAVNSRMAIVILQECQGLFKGGARNENDAHPVMNEATRH